MWYSSQQNAFYHRYAPSQNRRTDTRTSYYPSHVDDSSAIHLPSNSSICKSETTHYYHRTTHVNSVNEMNMSNSTIHQDSSPTQWNPTISTAPKVPVIVRDSLSSSTWDWLIYSPALDAQLYHPTSSFISSVKDIEEDSNLLLNLPSWLLALLYPSNSINHDADDENDQELNALDRRTQDETLRSIVNDNTEHVSSSSSTNVLILENRPNQKIAEEQNRSSTPDSDDGYQSASDASRSDCSHLQSVDNRKDSTKINTTSTNNGRRISYAAAAVKPLSNSLKTKNSNNESQKNKFIAPRFERMHHAKQYSSSSMTTSKDSSFIPRTQSRLNQSTRRR